MAARGASQPGSAAATAGDQRLVVRAVALRWPGSAAFVVEAPIASTDPAPGTTAGPLASAASVAADRWHRAPSAAGRPAVAFAAVHQVLVAAPVGLEAAG